jgi:two-component system, NarL family, invasion response regulator UvrY
MSGAEVIIMRARRTLFPNGERSRFGISRLCAAASGNALRLQWRSRNFNSPALRSDARNMTRILIADDHAVVRAGLHQFIAGHGDLEVVAEAANAGEVMEHVRDSKVDVVILDISMPGRSGIDVLASLRQIRPELPVLILSGFAEEQYAINLLRAGAAGYVNKEAAATQLVTAIRTVVQGRKYISPALAQLLANGLSAKDEDVPVHGKLSRREFQIFCKLAKGDAVTQIAEELFLSVKTISTYRTRILSKMGMKSNADLTYYAIKNQLIN